MSSRNWLYNQSAQARADQNDNSISKVGFIFNEYTESKQYKMHK